MIIDKLCMGCMTEMQGDYTFCPKCGRKVDETNSARGLQPHTVLNGKYIIGRVLGEGGFGITYIAYDTVLNYRVAIKEYFPSELVSRDTSNGGNTSLSVLTGSKEEQYKKGIERFIKEAGNLAKFNNLPGIVSVKEFFYANNTAYMVMEYIDGISLSKYLELNGGKIPYSKVLEMMTPVMDSLEKVHSAGIIHRDISPDNIMITKDGRIKLIDFGAARIVDNKDVKSLTVILKHGFAPKEQYHPDGHQGPWTDVYALSATMYRMITGIVPQESTDRILSKDKVVAVNKIVSNVPKKVSDAIMHGLSVKATNRPQNISELKKEFERKKSIIIPLLIFAGASVAIATVIAAAILGLGIFLNIDKINQGTQISHSFEDTEKTEKDAINKTDTVSDNQNEIKETVKEETSDPQNDEVIDEPKTLSPEEELARKNKFKDAIMNAVGVDISDFCSYEFYDDFDGDGDKELFVLTYYGYGIIVVFYSGDNGVWMESWDDSYTEFSFVNVSDRPEVTSSIKDNVNYDEYTIEDVESFTVASDVLSFGKQKLWYYSVYVGAGLQKDYCYTILNGEPKVYNKIIVKKEDLAFLQDYKCVKCFTAMGEEVYTGVFYTYYAPYFLNGQFGELASCYLNEEQYYSIPGLSDQIYTYMNYTKNNLGSITYPFGGGWPSDEYSITTIDLDSVLYNEEGYFIINYKCYCDFHMIQSDSYWNSGKITYYINLVENYYEDINYSGNASDMNVDTVEGIYTHVILKYDGDTYTLVDCDNGYIGSSVSDNVLAMSECTLCD